MLKKKNIVAICGSTKASSSNLSLIRAIVKLNENDFNFKIISNIDSIPHFNPDLDNEMPPELVVNFRSILKSSDGILISTPEYAMGVPGTLKNAIDWTVSSCEFSHKPTALITASSQGQKGHQSLLETLNIIESNITNETQLLISFIKTKMGNDNIITDNETKIRVLNVMEALKNLIK